eukprot:TRINITY_DN3822_c0_g1_i1.p1 TRINITY_DN3822_c0_g1~~TRINITY_DN3822_c0_g1_i1.p1  ORF type:complete len:219 (+),score=11.32 TRINITY_DN3822_c0_g1_i1:64-720(+)
MCIRDSIYGICYTPRPGVENSSTMSKGSSYVDRWYSKSMEYRINKQLRDAHPEMKKFEIGFNITDCTEWSGAVQWLNQPEVQAALHIPSNLPKWDTCNTSLKYTPDFDRGSIWIYPLLLKSNMRILVYSGDTDGCVPTIGTMRWVSKLAEAGLISLLNPMRQWHVQEPDGTKQVAGYVTEYTNLHLVTFRGAGHMVPQSKPKEALKALNSFIQNAKLD